jgi:DNA-binding IclR family transcriptional regulator
MAKQPRLIAAVNKAIDVLELVANARNGFRLRDIAAVLDLHRQSAYKLLQTLVFRGLLVKEGSPPRYKLGSTLHGLRDQHDQWYQEVLVPGIPKAIRLARLAPSYIAISQYVGGQVISRFHSFRLDGTGPWVSQAAPTPPYGTAVLFQAYMQPAELAAYQKRHAMASNDDLGFWHSVVRLNEFLPLVREQGYLAMLKAGNFRVAAPIFGRDGQMVASLVMTKTYANMEAGSGARLVGLVRQAAAELSLSSGKRADER